MPPSPAGIVVWFQDKGWMDELEMGQWIKYWNKMRPREPCSRAMLVLDSFLAHISDQTKLALSSDNTDLAVISGADGSNSLTKGRNLKHANLNTVCYWVLDTGNNVSYDIVIWLFKKCSISNRLSGNEDYLIYKNNSENLEDAKSVNNNTNIDNPNN
ncbi:39889_t:CDS:2 [Gigaspora margarita]|uniref:39889_t:CDS:1 n=1 Tax=Gigaspora margarita TaxID=4874 RepID=A0ABN7V372_GIGMA|nr:39889_t:CDS:2 [Gigaspora margarita]